MDSHTEKKGNVTNEREADILEVIIQKTENSESFIVDDKLQENDESFLLNVSQDRPEEQLYDPKAESPFLRASDVKIEIN